MNVLEALEEIGAVYTDSHFVLTSGRHSPAYVNVRAIAPEVTLVDDLGLALAVLIETDLGIEAGGKYVLVGPETLGRTLAGAVALNTEGTIALWCDVAGDGADKNASWPPKMQFEGWLTPSTKAVVVDDLLTSGSSVKPVIALLRSRGVEVLGVAVVVRRNPDVTAATLNVPKLWVLEDVNSVSYPADDCPMCVTGVPLRLRPGHGWRFAELHPNDESVVNAI